MLLKDFLLPLLVGIILLILSIILGIGRHKTVIKNTINKTEKNIQKNEAGYNLNQKAQNIYNITNYYGDPSQKNPIRISSTEVTGTMAVEITPNMEQFPTGEKS